MIRRPTKPIFAKVRFVQAELRGTFTAVAAVIFMAIYKLIVLKGTTAIDLAISLCASKKQTTLEFLDGLRLGYLFLSSSWYLSDAHKGKELSNSILDKLSKLKLFTPQLILNKTTTNSFTTDQLPPTNESKSQAIELFKLCWEMIFSNTNKLKM